MRRTSIDIRYNGTNIGTTLEKYLEKFKYTDTCDKSDSISIAVENIDKRWLNEWMPNKEDTIGANVIFENWNKEGEKKIFKCGTFIVDDVNFSGRPLMCDIGGVSAPVNLGFMRTKNTRTWENTTLHLIAQDVAKRAGLGLVIEVDTVRIVSVEQSEKTDSDFLVSLCKDYGIILKIYNNKLHFFDEAKLEAKAPTITFSENDMKNWEYNTTLTGTYTAGRITYTNPDTEEDIEVIIGEGNRVLDINIKVDNYEDAELKATARINEENKKAETIRFSIMGNPNITTCMTINITGLGKASGKYFTEQITHSLSSGGYEMEVIARKVQARIVKTVPPQPVGTAYVIKSGDTLWMLAKEHYGNGVEWTRIYNANSEIIEEVAKSKGLANSNGGHWIYPGTTITIPV